MSATTPIVPKMRVPFSTELGYPQSSKKQGRGLPVTFFKPPQIASVMIMEIMYITRKL